MLLGLEIQTWLALTGVAAVISTLGSLFGLVLKEVVFTRSFESWKQEKILEKIYEKYRDPIILAARELCIRLHNILEDFPPSFLTSEVLRSSPTKQTDNSTEDPYFRKHMLTSTSYRVCAFLGWIELYRQELVFLDSGRAEHTRALEKCIDSIRGDFADGQLNTADNWEEWTDNPIAREELRAIGEVMLVRSADGSGIMGYAQFCEQLETREKTSFQRWVATTNNLLLDLEDDGADFRKVRSQRLVGHLLDLLELLDDKPLGDHLIDLRKAHAADRTSSPAKPSTKATV